MGSDHSSARERAEDLRRGVDPDALGHAALDADIGRATEAADSRQLDARCVRAAYEAIAAAGGRTDAADDATLVSLRSGAQAAADAARVADEIGAGAGGALRAAARAWQPFAVEGEAATWRVGLKAFSETCEGDAIADQQLVVRAVGAAAAAVGGDDSATARAARAFSGELQRRVDEGEDLSTAWAGAVRHTRDEAPDDVFLVVVDAVTGVLDR
ncbi:hypothetical protein [Pseudonocardia sp. NPDC049635]|uniref:hypothetical protein n=1 Tax=Pseudonocardia sp. NPDC049635 TaxID=3155506 RepID=UPI0033C8DBC4